MKIAFTIADASHAMHVGGEVKRETHVMELDVNKIPHAVMEHLLRVEKGKTEKRFDNFESMSISIVKDW